MLKIIEWIDARVNPIMVKEIYQGFRGRGFMIGYSAALVISLFGYMAIVLTASLHDETLGSEFFTLLIICMGVVALLTIPTSAGTQLRNEIASQTLDLIAITNLSPWAIVSGRFQAAGLKLLLLFSYMGPFAIAAFLLGGIGVGYILFVLGVLLLYALVFCALTLMLSALPALNPRFRSFAAGAQSLLIVFVSIQAAVVMAELNPGYLFSSGSFFDWDFLFITGMILMGVSFTIVFFLRMAADMLTPPGMRSFRLSKAVLMLLLLLMCAPFLEDIFSGALNRSETEALLVFSLFPLYFFAIFWGGQKHTPTRKDRKFYLLEDGYTPTLVYVASITLIVSSMAFVSQENERWLLAGLGFISTYALFTGPARMLRRWMKPHKRTFLVYQMFLLGLVILNVIATIVFFSKTSGSVTKYPEIIVVFLPLAWFDSSRALTHLGLWMFLPLGIGLLAAALGREKAAT